MHDFECSCGNSVAILPPSKHAGYVVLDADVDFHIDARTEKIRGFLAAVRGGNRDKWAGEFFGDNAPHSRLSEKDDADIIEDILSSAASTTRHLYRCPTCGRVYIETSPQSNKFQGYTEE